MDGPSPYRAGKPLAEIIPPDRRRVKTLALVLASMTFGISMWVLGGMVLAMIREASAPVSIGLSVPRVSGRIQPAMLHGPGGDLAMPPRQRSVVHVWLQGCQDCMPKFEAIYELEKAGGLGVTAPIINVAYEEADLTWAKRYGVDQNLVFDVGGRSVVKPLGIGTFTTLVVAADGAILHRDYPDRPGYRDRVRAALGPGNLVSPPSPPPTSAFDEQGPLDSNAIQSVLAAHRTALKRTCWEGRPAQLPTSARVTVTLTIAASGHVDATRAVGNDLPLQRCLEKELLGWRFPASQGMTTASIPFVFTKE